MGRVTCDVKGDGGDALGDSARIVQGGDGVEHSHVVYVRQGSRRRSYIPHEGCGQPDRDVSFGPGPAGCGDHGGAMRLRSWSRIRGFLVENRTEEWRVW